MRIAIWIAGLGAAGALLAQQTAEHSTVWTTDLNGNRVAGPSYSYIETPRGSQRVETQQSINGRLVPIQSTEDKVLHEDSQNKVVERVILKYDATGAPGRPITVHIEEKKNPDGSSTVQSTFYETDLNGNKQLYERAVTEVRKGASQTETSTTVDRATLNGGLQTVERNTTVERKSGDTANVESTTFRRDISGNFTPFAQEVKQVTKSNGLETADAARYETGPDGKLVLASRSIDHIKKNADGSEVVDTDVYSRFSAGKTADVNADAPRLQEQIHTERTPGAGGSMIETTSVRSRLPNDQSQFGVYEKVSQTTYTGTDAGGHKIETNSNTVSRRGPNGDIVVDQGMVNQTVTTKK